MIRKLAKVQLPEQAIKKMAFGKTVTIRLDEYELELSFDPKVRIGGGTLEDMIAEQLHLSERRFGRSR
jgi:hypothetical protein